MPHNIRLDQNSGLLVFKYDSSKKKFTVHWNFHEFSNNQECYLFAISSDTLYRGIYRKLDENEFQALNLASAGVKYGNDGDFFIGRVEPQFNEQNEIQVTQETKSCKIVSLAGTGPGLPTPATGSYSFTNADAALLPELADAVDRDALNAAIQETRENIEITNLYNTLYNFTCTAASLNRWKLYKEIYERHDIETNPLVREKLLKLVSIYQNSTQYDSFDQELLLPIASLSRFNAVWKAIGLGSQGQPQPREQGPRSCKIL